MFTSRSRWTQRTAIAFAGLLGAASTTARAADWPSWRGPEHSGLAREAAVVTRWSPDGENLLWKSPEGGRTTPIVMNGRVFFIGPVGDGECLRERVICLDAETGRVLWEHRFNVFFTDIVANRVGWTAVVGDPQTGHIYAHGTGGELWCFDRDGKIVWRRSLTEEFNRVSGYGGRLMNPIIDEDCVVVSFLNTNWGGHAAPRHRYVAFDRRDGRVVWWAEPGGPPADTTYAIPIVMVADGRRLLVAPNADGRIYGLEARTGRTIWSYALSRTGLNSSPVTDGHYVYVSHSEENLDTTVMGRLVCLDPSAASPFASTTQPATAREVWRLDGLDIGYASPALANGRLYLVDNSATLHCVDAKTGKRVWGYKLGRVGKGSAVVTTDGVIYVGEQNGIFYILKDAGAHCQLLSKHEFRGPDAAVDEIFGSPAVCGGRVYFMTRYGTYCLGIRGKTAAAGAPPAAPQEAPAMGQKPATMLLVPADVTLAPGEKVRFETRIYGEKGGLLTLAASVVQWGVQGAAATIDNAGNLTAVEQPVFSAGLVTAKSGFLSATARVRIVPPLPIREDFEGMQAGTLPPGWAGVVGKSRIVERDGSRVFQKLAEKARPSSTFKMRAFSGWPVAAGYTVEADILGTLARRRFRPDMGLINARYELALLGQMGELELSRWRDEPTHALRRRLPFELRPNVWYRMKLRVEPAGAKAWIRGKVWLRDEAEPAAWNIELEDPCPNTEGSPGLFAISNGTTDKSDGAAVFFDNYQVYPNE